jgi:hypothetical protein
MDEKMKEAVATIGRNTEIVDLLDGVLTEPGDRAYIICSVEECRNNFKGSCSIHTVKSQRVILSNGHCRDYVM